MATKNDQTSDLTPQTHALALRLTRKELAAFWRVSVRTIERRDAAGTGPKAIRIGNRLLYRREDVLAWEQSEIDRSEG